MPLKKLNNRVDQVSEKDRKTEYDEYRAGDIYDREHDREKQDREQYVHGLAIGKRHCLTCQDHAWSFGLALKFLLVHGKHFL